MTEQYDSTEIFDVAAVNGMLRGEMAAVETYNLAIRKTATPAIVAELEAIRDEHRYSVCSLRHWVRDLKETPSAGSGMWGLFASALTGAASIVGESAVLGALRRGERHGEEIYRSGMGNPDLPDECRHLIGSKLLPNCQEHLATLERLLTP